MIAGAQWIQLNSTATGGGEMFQFVLILIYYRKGSCVIMTGLWMPAILEDGNGNVDPKCDQIFTNSFSNEDTHILSAFSTVNK